MSTPVTTAHAPQAVGANSQAFQSGGLIFPGQGPRDPTSGTVVGSSIEEQTGRVITDAEAVPEEASCSLADVVRVNTNLSVISSFERFTAAYARRFPSPFPARTTVACGLDGILVEMHVIARCARRGGRR